MEKRCIEGVPRNMVSATFERSLLHCSAKTPESDALCHHPVALAENIKKNSSCLNFRPI